MSNMLHRLDPGQSFETPMKPTGEDQPVKLSPSDLDSAVTSNIGACRSLVADWLKKSKASNKSKTKKYEQTVQEPNFAAGRPPRLGIGAKVTSQKEQLSNSVFLNQNLARTLTGQPMDKKANGSFMSNYTNKKSNAVAVKAVAEVESDEEESRTKSLGKRPAPQGHPAKVEKKR